MRFILDIGPLDDLHAVPLDKEDLDISIGDFIGLRDLSKEPVDSLLLLNICDGDY